MHSTLMHTSTTYPIHISQFKQYKINMSETYWHAFFRSSNVEVNERSRSVSSVVLVTWDVKFTKRVRLLAKPTAMLRSSMNS